MIIFLKKFKFRISNFGIYILKLFTYTCIRLKIQIKLVMKKQRSLFKQGLFVFGASPLTP